MSEHRFGLSEACTLVLAVPVGALGEVAAAEAISLGALTLVRKKEHHATVFGYPIGKLLKKALSAQTSLRLEIDAAIDASDWTVEVGKTLLHLERTNDRGTLHTVIVRVEAPLAAFFSRVAAIVRERAADHAELIELLAAAPPPHVTLYTSDRAGAAGIGLTSEAELAAALARAAAGEVGLRAYTVSAGEIGAAPPISSDP